MIVMEIDGSLIWNSLDDAASSSAAGAPELPADLLAQHSDLLDRVFRVAFDLLGLHPLDLWIRRYVGCVTIPTSRPVAGGSS
jgi:hypothetical protein